MGPIINSGHELKQFSGSRGVNSLLTFGADGHVVLRMSNVTPDYGKIFNNTDKSKFKTIEWCITTMVQMYVGTEFKVTVSHRYEAGLKEAVADDKNSVIMHLGRNKTVAVLYRNGMRPELRDEPQADPPDPSLFEQSINTLTIIHPNDSKLTLMDLNTHLSAHNTETLMAFTHCSENYLDLQEDKKVHEESIDYKKQRDEVVKLFQTLKTELVTLLEENIKEPPLHQLSLSEFNLHLEHKKDRLRAVCCFLFTITP